MIDFKSLDDNTLVAWSTKFYTKIKEFAPVLGLSQQEVSEVGGDSASTKKLVDVANQVKEMPLDPALKDEFYRYKGYLMNGPSESLKNAFPGVFSGLAAGAVAGLLPRILDLVNGLKNNPQMTSEVASSLGIDQTTVDKLRAGDNTTLGWLGNFVDKIKGHKEELDLRDEDVEAVDKHYETMQHVVRQTDEQQNNVPNHPQLQDLLNYKDMILNGPSEALTKALPAIAPAALALAPGIIPRFKGMIEKVMHSGNFNETIARELGVTGQKPTVEEARELVGARTGPEQRPGVSPAVEHPEEPRPSSWVLPTVLGLILLGLLLTALWPRHPRGVPARTGAGPLIISNVRVMPGNKEAVVTWDTNRPTTGQIEYGKTQSLEAGVDPKTVNTNNTQNLLKVHSLRLMGLDKGVHYVRVMSMDKDRSAVVSKTFSFQVP